MKKNFSNAGLLILGFLAINFKESFTEVQNLKLSQSINFNTGKSNKKESPNTTTKTATSKKLDKNTIVQVFAECNKIYPESPYEARQISSCGSGFIIKNPINKKQNKFEYLIASNNHVIENSIRITIQIPSLGKKRFEIEPKIIGQGRDIAIMSISDEILKLIKKELGKIPCLEIGDSDVLKRGDKISAIGYPLGEQSLKITEGTISGYEYINLRSYADHSNLDGTLFVQHSSPINPGNSGGPALNSKNKVIGINSVVHLGAQNVGYFIPINQLKLILDQAKKQKKNSQKKIFLAKKPFIGANLQNSYRELNKYKKNPEYGGPYITTVWKDGLFEKADIKKMDMISKINGTKVDEFGEMKVPWCEDKVNIYSYLYHLKIGGKINLELFRDGKLLKKSFILETSNLPSSRKICLTCENLEYEIIGGLLIIPITFNLFESLMKKTYIPITSFCNPNTQSKNKTAIAIAKVFPGSQAKKIRVLENMEKLGNLVIIKKVNNIPVNTIKDFRNAISKNSLKTNNLVIETTKNKLLVLNLKKVLDEEEKISENNMYPITPFTRKLIKRKTRN